MLLNIHKNADGETTLEIGVPAHEEGRIRSVTWTLTPGQLDILLLLLQATQVTSTLTLHLEL